MKSRAVRLALLSVFVAASGATAYLFWVGESRSRAEIEAGRSFDDRAGAAVRDVLELRAAQQAYVAAGQGGRGSTGWAHERRVAQEDLVGPLTMAEPEVIRHL